ncbi:MAG: hypothetical protein Q6366_007975, partial [Candidatus Freyarchaeota archaeon]
GGEVDIHVGMPPGHRHQLRRPGPAAVGFNLCHFLEPVKNVVQNPQKVCSQVKCYLLDFL